MSYATCRDAVKTNLLLLTSTFGASDITNGDYRVLDSGSTNAVVMLPGTLVQPASWYWRHSLQRQQLVHSSLPSALPCPT